MVIYEYRCVKCDEIFERISTMAHYTATAACPRCNNIGERYFNSKPNFILRGDDWPGKKIKKESKNGS